MKIKNKNWSVGVWFLNRNNCVSVNEVLKMEKIKRIELDKKEIERILHALDCIRNSGDAKIDKQTNTIIKKLKKRWTKCKT